MTVSDRLAAGHDWTTVRPPYCDLGVAAGVLGPWPFGQVPA